MSVSSRPAALREGASCAASFAVAHTHTEQTWCDTVCGLVWDVGPSAVGKCSGQVQYHEATVHCG